MGFMETSWLELARDHVQWRALILALALAEDRVLRVIGDFGIWGYAVGGLVHYRRWVSWKQVG